MNPFVGLAKKAVETYIKTGEKIKPINPVPAEMKKRAGVFVSIYHAPKSWCVVYKKEDTVMATKNLSPATQKPSPKQLADGMVGSQVKPVLRGCIGTYLPTQKNTAAEIIFNAISAATADPRFPPVTEHELSRLTYSVDILSTPEKVKDISELNPKKYGIILVQGSKRGLLLPDLPGVETTKQQIQITALKAVIDLSKPFRAYRFTTVRKR